jgi:hypothetical protein
LSITLVLVEPQPHTKPSMTKKQKCLGLIWIAWQVQSHPHLACWRVWVSF